MTSDQTKDQQILSQMKQLADAIDAGCDASAVAKLANDVYVYSIDFERRQPKIIGPMKRGVTERSFADATTAEDIIRDGLIKGAGKLVGELAAGNVGADAAARLRVYVQQLSPAAPSTLDHGGTTGTGLGEIADAIVEAIGKTTTPLTTAEEIAPATVYPCDSRFRGKMADLKRLQIIDKIDGKYVVTKKS